LAVHINSQNRTGQQTEVLAVAFRVFLRTCVARADVKVTVRTERQHATPVEISLLVNLQQPPRWSTCVLSRIFSGVTLGDDG